MVSQYKLLLDFIPIVTRNESGDAIDRVLSTIGSSKSLDFLLTMYDLTLERLKQMADTERMRFNVQMKLCKTYLELGNTEKGQEVRTHANQHAGASSRAGRSSGVPLLILCVALCFVSRF